jgi:hypothetical protein
LSIHACNLGIPGDIRCTQSELQAQVGLAYSPLSFVWRILFLFLGEFAL